MTLIVETISAEVSFVALVKLAILPEPLAARPIAVLSFVQVKVVPLGAPLKVVETAPPEQTDILVGCVTVGVGFIVIEYVFVDVHPLA